MRDEVQQLARDYGASEVIVVTITHDHEARKRSYELVASALGLIADASPEATSAPGAPALPAAERSTGPRAPARPAEHRLDRRGAAEVAILEPEGTERAKRGGRLVNPAGGRAGGRPACTH